MYQVSDRISKAIMLVLILVCLADSLSWRSLFFLNVPLGIAIIIGLVFVKERPMEQKNKQSIDLTGAIAVLLGIFVLVYGSWT